MDILLTTATGRGPTELAAFDAALVAAGVADRNLIYLSSVLPPGSAVDQVDRIADTPGGWGSERWRWLGYLTVSEDATADDPTFTTVGLLGSGLCSDIVLRYGLDIGGELV